MSGSAELAWVRRVLGPEWSIGAPRALAGATTGKVLALDAHDASGHRRRLVLKTDRPDPTQPDSARREAHILSLLAGTELNVPRVVALDRDGAEAGRPALLMTRLAGRGGTHRMPPRLRELATLASHIHAVPIAETDLPRYGLWGHEDRLAVPDWWADAGIWRAAVEIFRGPMPDEPSCFIHRDFHPGNVMWSGGRAVGIVDWLHGCWGPPTADLAHCRINLWLDHGPAAARGLLDEYRKLRPQMALYDRYWDIADAMSWHLDPKQDGLHRARRWESFITAALRAQDVT